MATPTLEERIVGGLVGSAVGDALGAPTETMHYEDVRRFLGDYGTFEDLERIFAALEPDNVRGSRAIVRRPFHPLGSADQPAAATELLSAGALTIGGRLSGRRCVLPFASHAAG